MSIRSLNLGMGLWLWTDYVEVDMRSLVKRTRGQGLVEYALIIALVAVVVIGALILLGPQIAAIFDTISSAL